MVSQPRHMRTCVAGVLNTHAREDLAMWISNRDSSAEEPLTPEQVERWQRRCLRQRTSSPRYRAAVLLPSTDDVAVGLTQVEAFSTGFRFNLAVRVRRLRPELVRGDLFMHVSWHVLSGS